jgi:hypothetical protein
MLPILFEVQLRKVEFVIVYSFVLLIHIIIGFIVIVVVN